MTGNSIVLSVALGARLPHTHALLVAADLTLHPRVTRVTLHGSRGLRGGFRPDSDIDLSLLTTTVGLTDREELGRVLRAVLETTLSNWQGAAEPDLAAIFDIKGCGLACFSREAYDEGICQVGGVDCFGMYKILKGFSGFVPKIGIEVKKMYPCLVIWERPKQELHPPFPRKFV